MKVNRLELIARIQTLISQRTLAAKERHEQALDEASGSERRYLDEHAGDWAKFATIIRTRLRQGRAITIQDVPESLRGGSRSWPEVRVFSPTVVKESAYRANTEALSNLLAVLESSPDELISTSALAQIGAPLKELLRP